MSRRKEKFVVPFEFENQQQLKELLWKAARLGVPVHVTESPRHVDLSQLPQYLSEFKTEIEELLTFQTQPLEQRRRTNYETLLLHVFEGDDFIASRKGLIVTDNNQQAIKETLNQIFLECTKVENQPRNINVDTFNAVTWNIPILSPFEARMLIGYFGLNDGNPKSLRSVSEDLSTGYPTIVNRSKIALTKLKNSYFKNQLKEAIRKD